MSANFNYNFYNKNVKKCFLLFYGHIHVFFYFSVMGNRWNETSPYILRIQFFKILKNNIFFYYVIMSFFAQNTSETGKMVYFYLFICLASYRTKNTEQNALKVHILSFCKASSIT